MMQRFLRWVEHRQASILKTNQARQRAENRITTAEAIVAAQKRESQEAVNVLYDRLTHNDGGKA